MKFTKHNLTSLLAMSGLTALSRAGAQAQKPVARPASANALPAPTPAVDAATGIVHSQRLLSGVPLGGIGAGTFQLMTDGTVSHAAIANNWNRPLADSPGCFAALWTRTETRTSARALALASPYALPTVARLDYDGLFPQAILTYPDSALPVQAALVAFSPLIPFDVKNSSFPAVAYVLRLKNPGTAPVEVSAALSWENMLPAAPVSGPVSGNARANTDIVGTNGSAAIIPSGEGFFGARLMREAEEPDGGTMALLAYPQRAQAVVTTALWSADAARPGWWDAFAREGTVTETQAGRENGGKPDAAGETTPQTLTRPAAVVAVRLTLKPGENVELPFAVSWYAPHLKTPAGEDIGPYYQVAFSSAEDAARRLLEDWRSLYGLTEEWQKRLTFSNLPRWSARRLINAAAPLAANTIHTRDNRFAFLGTAGTVGTVNITAGREKTVSPGGEDKGARAAHAGGVLTPLESEREETRAHECADALLLAFFPQLAAQELAQFATMQDRKGFVVPPASDDWAARLGPPPTKKSPSKPNTVPAPPAIFSPPPSSALDPFDAGCAYALQATQFALWTGDPDFVKQNYPHVRLALRALLTLPGLNTGLNSSDQQREKTKGKAEDSSFLLPPSSFSLWLAALRAGQKMARLAGDDAFARECETAFQQASAQGEAQHWNGQFYTDAPQSAREGKSAANAPAPDALCAADQLWGQWLAYQLDLGPLLPTEHLLRAARSVQQRNDQAASALPAALPAWRVRGDGKMPDVGNVTAAECLLPASILADAAVNIWQDQPEAGVTLLRRLEDGRSSVARSPWQYPARVGKREEGKGKREDAPVSNGLDKGKATEQEQSHFSLFPLPFSLPSSLAVAADWNLLYALQGFALDAQSGQMTLAPNIPGTWRAFNAPVFAPTFWGRMEYRPTAHGGVTTFRLDRLIGFVTTPASSITRSRAELTLTTLRVLGPPRHQDNTLPIQFTAHVSLGQKPIGCRATLDAGGFVTLAFDSPLTLTAGDRLEVDMH